MEEKINEAKSTVSLMGLGCKLISILGLLLTIIYSTILFNEKDNKNIYLTSTIPLITTNSVLTNTTQNISSLSINSITEPEVDNATGEVIYLDNRSPVIRSADQVEQIKALIRF